MSRAGDTERRGEILDVAELLVSRRGFNGFSYADVASELGMTTAALHYHFPGKAELGRSLIERYTERFGSALVVIGAGPGPAAEKLAAYCDLYVAVLRDRRMCLCGMLAAEFDTLPEPMRAAILAFFEQSESWLTSLLAPSTPGVDAGDDQARRRAQMVVAALEGAMLVARPRGDVSILQAVAARLVADVT